MTVPFPTQQKTFTLLILSVLKFVHLLKKWTFPVVSLGINMQVQRGNTAK